MTIPLDRTRPPLPPIEYDPPLHSDFRRLLAPFFMPKSIGNLEYKARDLTTRLIDSFIDRGECEFVSEFALAMPIGIFMGLVDLPEADRLHLLDIAEAIVRGATPEAQGMGFMRANQYLAEVFAARRAKPGEDMLSALIKGSVDGGRPLTDTELVAMGSLLLAAGLDTVASMMGFITMFLAQHEQHRHRLIDHPELIPVAVEELMRRHATANVGRLVIEDVEIGGVAMKAGDMVLTATTLACLDDRQFDDPMRVDFDRADKRSLVFGKGPHQCIGAHLARTEIRVFLGEWLTRIPDFGIRPGETPVSVPGRGNSVKYLPLVWPVGQAA
jgi:cytochrome P450